MPSSYVSTPDSQLQRPARGIREAVDVFSWCCCCCFPSTRPEERNQKKTAKGPKIELFTFLTTTAAPKLCTILSRRRRQSFKLIHWFISRDGKREGVTIKATVDAAISIRLNLFLVLSPSLLSRSPRPFSLTLSKGKQKKNRKKTPPPAVLSLPACFSSLPPLKREREWISRTTTLPGPRTPPPPEWRRRL